MGPNKKTESHIRCLSCIVDSFEECMSQVKQQNLSGYKLRNFMHDWEIKHIDRSYKYSTFQGFVEHHLAKHSEQKVRLVCMKCLTLFDEPGLAEQHIKLNLITRNMKLIIENDDDSNDEERTKKIESKDVTIVPFYCKLCKDRCFASKQELAEHAKNKHDVNFCDYNWEPMLFGARKLKAGYHKATDTKVVFWSWTGIAFTPMAERRHDGFKLKLSPGCNYIPKWPYEVVFGCGMCDKVCDQKKKIVLHLKFKHCISTPDKRIVKSEHEKDELKEVLEEVAEPGVVHTCDQENEDGDDSSSEASSAAPYFSRHFRSRFKSSKRRYYCNKLYKCRRCEKLFDTDNAAFQHDDNCHPLDYQGKDEEIFKFTAEDFCCTYCDSRFPLNISTLQHSRTKHPEYFPSAGSRQTLAQTVAKVWNKGANH